jgi:hypothetical protein
LRSRRRISSARTATTHREQVRCRPSFNIKNLITTRVLRNPLSILSQLLQSAVTDCATPAASRAPLHQGDLFIEIGASRRRRCRRCRCHDVVALAAPTTTLHGGCFVIGVGIESQFGTA